MRASKEFVLAELGEDIQGVYQRAHGSLSRQQFKKVNELRNSIAALKDELEIVQKTPTWPWRSDTLRNMLTPLLLPIFISLAQRFWEHFSGLRLGDFRLNQYSGKNQGFF